MLNAREHGLLDPFASTDDAATLTKDVVDFVHVMKLLKPILMGNSIGCYCFKALKRLQYKTIITE